MAVTVEQGSHEELLKLGGVYAKLHALQHHAPDAPIDPAVALASAVAS